MAASLVFLSEPETVIVVGLVKELAVDRSIKKLLGFTDSLQFQLTSIWPSQVACSKNTPEGIAGTPILFPSPSLDAP